ncbi:NAD-dependent epimerase/dehydratase family protein [Cyclobacteriaceae bacterium YHN15]|nr:NAD-dependent epimerase/dehydratase family protein [Cyclobacteriaceae bacterium YHN15]
MRVLVLGGTGAIGVHLVKNLSKNGFDTYVTSRSYKKAENNLNYLQGNAKDISFLKEILSEQWGTIVDFMVYSTDEFKTRFDLLLNSTSQYMFISSARVYAESIQPITETSDRLLDVSKDSEFLLTDEYALAKARQEDILKNSGRKNWTIVRPYITFSEQRLQLGVFEKEDWLYRGIKGRTIVFSSDILSKVTTMTYGLDVSKGLFSLIGKQKSLENSFHITASECYTWDEILNLYLSIIEKYLGFRPKVLLQNMNGFLELHPGKYQVKYDRLFNRRFDNSKIKQYLDLNVFTNPITGLKKCLEGFLMDPKFKPINWRLEALKDKLSKETTPLNEIPGVKSKIIYIMYRNISLATIKKIKSILN